jgi:hypothetical protein
MEWNGFDGIEFMKMEARGGERKGDTYCTIKISKEIR